MSLGLKIKKNKYFSAINCKQQRHKKQFSYIRYCLKMNNQIILGVVHYYETQKGRRGGRKSMIFIMLHIKTQRGEGLKWSFVAIRNMRTIPQEMNKKFSP